MQIEFIMHLHLNMSVVNQFSGAKRRDGSKKLSGGTTTDHFRFSFKQIHCFFYA